MFDKFGDMDSAAEINTLAENLFNEGDMDSIRLLARENGIPEEYAEDYIRGEGQALCDVLCAALGKLDIEAGALKPYGIMNDWVSYIQGQCMKSGETASAVRKKDRTLKGCMAILLGWSFKNARKVDTDIVRAAGVTGAEVKLGIPDIGRARKLIRRYYLGGGEDET